MENLKIMLSVFLAAVVMFSIVYVGISGYSNNVIVKNAEDIFVSEANVDTNNEVKTNIPRNTNNSGSSLNLSAKTQVQPLPKQPSEEFLAIQQEHPDIFYDAGPSEGSVIEVGSEIWPVTQNDIAELDKRFESNLREIEKLRAKARNGGY